MERNKKSRASKTAPQQNQIIREVMDIQSLAEYLDLGKSKIYALIRQKKIPASRIGRQYRFSKDVIDQWLREKLITQNTVSPQMHLFDSEVSSNNNEPSS